MAVTTQQLLIRINGVYDQRSLQHSEGSLSSGLQVIKDGVSHMMSPTVALMLEE